MRSGALLRINPTRSEGLDGDVWEETLADIRGHIHEFGNFGKLAELSGLGSSTISNLACGETKSPHLRTIQRVMEALGKGEDLRRALKSQKPVSRAEARLKMPIRKKVAARRRSAKEATKFVRASVKRGG